MIKQTEKNFQEIMQQLRAQSEQCVRAGLSMWTLP